MAVTRTRTRPVTSLARALAVVTTVSAGAACFTTRPVAAQAPDSGAVAAPATSPAHTHIRHVAVSFRGTPDGMGLLPTAIAEAEIAARHAALAGSDTTDLSAMQRHAGHVLHALDPTGIEGGPGLGYGAKTAAERTAHWVELAMASDGAGDAIRTHGPHVAMAARGAAASAEEAVSIAKEIAEAESAEEAAALLDGLVGAVQRMIDGIDADGDGRVTWQEGEGGLAQARQHLDFLLRGEGMAG